MKKFGKLFIVAIAFVFALTLTACKKDETNADYSAYIGYQFSGKDPWGSELAVTVRKIENGKITWTFTDVIGSGETSLTLYAELETEIKDGSTSFNAKGKADDNNEFDYSGTLTLKDGALSIKLEKGQLTTKSSEGDSSSYQVAGLEDQYKTISLTKVVDKS